MDLLEQEKERLLREYRCETIAQVLELLEKRLAALKNREEVYTGIYDTGAVESSRWKKQ